MRRAALLALLALHCASRTSDAPRPPARVVIETRAGARQVVAVEVVRNDADRARGLMDRRELAPDSGMLFLFEETAEHPFWMKNTLIPLDMIFLAEDGRILGIVARAVPGDLTPRSAGGPSRFVLEVAGGWSEAHGVAAGDRVRFENVGLF
ncbi:MAG TPA: DUF192 domain-containing protein [Anaeromyxobacter sp.]